MTYLKVEMPKTYSQLMKQIESLKSEAEQIKRKEIDGVVDRIKEAIAAYGLTAADLGLNGKSPKAARTAPKAGRKSSKKAKAAAAAKVIKFKDDAGNTWGGRGPRPQWLRDALAGGKALQDLRA